MYMQLKTYINPRFLIRLGIVGLLCVGMCIYCIYDGTVTYPNQQKYFDQYEKFVEEHIELDDLQRVDMWNETARTTHGWLGEDLKKRRSAYDINGQFVMAAVTGLIGFIFLVKLLKNRGRWIEATEEGLRSSDRREVAFDQITAFDKKLWPNKGIAKVLFEKNGRKTKIVLDDCNYMRDATQTILRHLEAKIDHAIIINGKPEPPPKPETPAPDDETD